MYKSKPRRVQAGASAIVVSNHGGRVLDFTPGAAEVLPAIVDRVKGKAIVFVDGGVRSGSDVLKLLALGADAVLVGRPVLIAAFGGGRDRRLYAKKAPAHSSPRSVFGKMARSSFSNAPRTTSSPASPVASAF